MSVCQMPTSTSVQTGLDSVQVQTGLDSVQTGLDSVLYFTGCTHTSHISIDVSFPSHFVYVAAYEKDNYNQ